MSRHVNLINLGNVLQRNIGTSRVFLDHPEAKILKNLRLGAIRGFNVYIGLPKNTLDMPLIIPLRNGKISLIFL